MSNDKPGNLEPIDPSTARKLYLEHKRTEAAPRTVESHTYRTSHFVRWCDEVGIDDMNVLSGRDLHKFRLWRKEDGDLNAVSLRTQMSTFRVFLKFCASIDAVSTDLPSKVMVPTVSAEEQQRDTLLDKDHMEAILQKLHKFEYSSERHTLLAILFETGIRVGALRGVDLGDLHLDEEYFEVHHRPETGTGIKNQSRGERPIAISGELREVIEGYIENARFEITDSYNRRPLLTTQNGRMSRSTMRRYVYDVSAPCFLDWDCPNCQADSEKSVRKPCHPMQSGEVR